MLIVFFLFSLGFLWARLLSLSFVCQIYCYRFYFQRLFPIVVYCLSSLFGELTICCEMQTKLDPSYPSSICGSIPYGYPTIATQLPVPGSSVAPVNAQREIRNSQLCIVPIWGSNLPERVHRCDHLTDPLNTTACVINNWALADQNY